MSNGHLKHSDAERVEILSLLDGGMTQRAVADRLGITKNVVAGIWARACRGVPFGPAPPTLFTRCAALHAKLDAVLAATRDVPRIPNEPPKPRQQPSGSL